MADEGLKRKKEGAKIAFGAPRAPLAHHGAPRRPLSLLLLPRPVVDPVPQAVQVIVHQELGDACVCVGGEMEGA